MRSTLLALLILGVTGAMVYHLADWSFYPRSAPRLATGFRPDSWMTQYAVFHPVLYGSLSVFLALTLGLFLAMFFRKGESLWSR